jgi:ribonuclease PH
MGERTIWIDCDVSSRRWNSRHLLPGLSWRWPGAGKAGAAGTLTSVPFRDYLAAVSIGIVDGEILLDLCYEEDSRADVDMNFVMTAGRNVEVQATAGTRCSTRSTGKDDRPGQPGRAGAIAKQQAVLRTLTLA